MAKNKPVGDNRRIGEVKNRSQFKRNKVFIKRNTTTGQFMNVSNKKFKGVRHEN
ncbi:hypothetical protein [Lentilactobacillus hilgardii]|uniref:hypothetical protein n=1 Tax=Lentilactobacillus hilgardii TaxID=1588 RepID=UPI00390CBC3D